MEIVQFAFYGLDPVDISQLVYDSLNGLLVPACALPWVEMIFYPGHPAYDTYDKMTDIKASLTQRLSDLSEDRELEHMMSLMLDYTEIIGLEMFKYGRKFQKMLDDEEKQGTP